MFRFSFYTLRVSLELFQLSSLQLQHKHHQGLIQISKRINSTDSVPGVVKSTPPLKVTPQIMAMILRWVRSVDSVVLLEAFQTMPLPMIVLGFHFRQILLLHWLKTTQVEYLRSWSTDTNFWSELVFTRRYFFLFHFLYEKHNSVSGVVKRTQPRKGTTFIRAIMS